MAECHIGICSVINRDTSAVSARPFWGMLSHRAMINMERWRVRMGELAGLIGVAASLIDAPTTFDLPDLSTCQVLR